jgi:myo-inositol-1(or 4)-monophosphatase
MNAPTNGTADLDAIGALTLRLARLAGDSMAEALGRPLEVQYKPTAETEHSLKDPVSAVDRAVEAALRAEIEARFPDHQILGEEFANPPTKPGGITWAIDPVDGTANFINGFPLFCGSIGVVQDGVPIAGALWCASSHALRAGVYHCVQGGPLMFEEEPVTPRRNPEVKRRLGGFRDASHRSPQQWEPRRTGSAAIECAFVAAGLMEVAQFENPNVWDIAGGLALVRATGGEAFCRDATGWVPLERFTSATDSDLRNWRKPMIVAAPGAGAALCKALG